MGISTTSYRNLPPTLHTKEELYSLIVAAAQVFRTKTYEHRMAEKGMSYLDLADEFFLSWLKNGSKPMCRKPVRGGKATNPAVELTLPISKNIAFYIVKYDLLSRAGKLTLEEREGIELESLSDLQEKD